MTEQELAALRRDYPEVPLWIIEREGMTLARARELMELRRRAFPATTTNHREPTLEHINEQLAAHDLMVMQQNNLRYAIYRINRGAVALHGTRYDTYARVGRSHPTLAAALTAARKQSPEAEVC